MDVSSVNIADAAVAIILLVSGALAFFRGAVRELLAIVGWVASAGMTFFAFDYVQPFARELIELPLVADGAGALAIFIATLVLFALIGGIVSRRIKESSLDAVDRSLGFVFGLLRGGAIISIAYVMVIWATLPDDPPDWLREARAGPIVVHGAAIVCRAIPPAARAAGNGACDKVSEAMRDTLDEAEVFELLSNPPPTVDSEQRDGYTNAERKAMERLIQGTE